MLLYILYFEINKLDFYSVVMACNKISGVNAHFWDLKQCFGAVGKQAQITFANYDPFYTMSKNLWPIFLM